MKRCFPLTLFILLTVCFYSQKLDSLNSLAEKTPDNMKKLTLYLDIEAGCELKDILKYSIRTVELADKLLKKFPEKKDTITAIKGIALNDIGYYYKEMGKTTKAVEYFLKSIKTHESIRDSNSMLAGYHNLAIILKGQEDTAGALKYLTIAEHIAENNRNDKMIIQMLNGIGLIYKQKGDYSKALSYYNRSLELARKTNKSKLIAGTLNSVGGVYQAQNKYQEAVKCFNEALELSKTFNDEFILANTLLYLGSIYQNNFKEYAKAEKFFLEALELSNKGHNLNSRESALKWLGLLYHKTNRDKEAFRYYYSYTTLRDSLRDEESRKTVLKKELQYTFDKKSAADSVKHEEEKKVQAAIIRTGESQLKQEKTLRYTLYGGISLLLVFGFTIYNRFRITHRQKLIIEQKNRETENQKHIIEEKQKEIVDSILYAERIQRALLAGRDLLDKKLGAENYFVLFKPKDIVSGDFYWATSLGSKPQAVSSSELPTAPADCELFYLGVCDSTGHGVPGAFMSLLNMGFLSEAIKEKNILEPSAVFDYVRKRLVESISREGQKDGFDGILVRIENHPDNINVHYSAANNTPVLISNGQLSSLPCDKMPVGKGERADKFTTHSVRAKRGDLLYLFTDGFADQFGGPKGKKFKYKQLEEILLQGHQLSMNEQKNILEECFNRWKGDLEQIDDICVMGIKL